MAIGVTDPAADDLHGDIVALATEDSEGQDDGDTNDSSSGDDGPIPVEPDGGIGDGAGPPQDDGPIPVEPDGGIGDGAGPPRGDGPFPVEPDGGIGDGAGPLPPEAPPIAVRIAGTSEAPERMTASEETEVFAFVEGGNIAIYDFDPDEDYLDFSQLGDQFDSPDDVIAAAWDFTNMATGEHTGILIALGNDQFAYIDGLSVQDLSGLSIDI